MTKKPSSAPFKNTVKWTVEEKGYTNVLLEIDNECDVRAYDHEILKQGRVHKLILLALKDEIEHYGVANVW